MLFKSVKGMYQVTRNYRDAFKLEEFESKYIEECMDKYPFIVGDISSGILRLKGFDTDPKSKCYIGNLEQYLDVSCSFGCPFYVLKRIHSDKEYAIAEEAEKNKKPEPERVVITPIEKENFDKESLVLKSNPAGKPHIVIDPQKINAIPKGELSQDLKESIKNDRSSSRESKPKPEPVYDESYVSASDDFDPSKVQGPKRNKNRNGKNGNGKDGSSNGGAQNGATQNPNKNQAKNEKKNNGNGKNPQEKGKPNSNEPAKDGGNGNPKKKNKNQKQNRPNKENKPEQKPETAVPAGDGNNPLAAKPEGGERRNNHHRHNNRNRDRKNNGNKNEAEVKTDGGK